MKVGARVFCPPPGRSSLPESDGLARKVWASIPSESFSRADSSSNTVRGKKAGASHPFAERQLGPSPCPRPCDYARSEASQIDHTSNIGTMAGRFDQLYPGAGRQECKESTFPSFGTALPSYWCRHGTGSSRSQEGQVVRCACPVGHQRTLAPGDRGVRSASRPFGTEFSRTTRAAIASQCTLAGGSGSARNARYRLRDMAVALSTQHRAPTQVRRQTCHRNTRPHETRIFFTG